MHIPTQDVMVIAIFFLLLLSTASAIFAKKRGKNPYLWFFLTFFFGLVGCLILVLTNLKKKAPVSPSPTNSTSQNPAPISRIKSNEWYFLDQTNEAHGPYPFSLLESKLQEGLLNQESYVWNETMEDWQRVKEIDSIFADKK